jgi:hypothetical protein
VEKRPNEQALGYYPKETHVLQYNENRYIPSSPKKVDESQFLSHIR